VLAQHRDKTEFRIGVLTIPVALNPNPLHLAAFPEFILANNGSIVLSLAGSDAGTAS
jgi:hypothetical protein